MADGKCLRAQQPVDSLKPLLRNLGEDKHYMTKMLEDQVHSMHSDLADGTDIPYV